MLRLNRKAQSTAEYAIVIALVVAAVVGMQVYVRRGLQARMHDAVQYMTTNTSTLGNLNQFEPGSIKQSNVEQTRTASDSETVASGGPTADQIARTGSETTGLAGSSNYENALYNGPQQ